MPFLGEVPITTFFSRAGSVPTKRKATTLNKKSSNKKRRKEAPEAISKAPSSDNSKGKEVFRRSPKFTRNEGESSTSPLVVGSRKQPEIVSFLTPPPTCNPHVTAGKALPLDAGSQLHASKPIDGVAIQRRTFFLPTPTTMPRPQSHYASESHRYSVAPDSQDSVLEPDHSSISYTSSRDPHNPFSMSPGSPQPSTPKRRDRFPSSIQTAFLQKDNSTFEDFASDRTMVVGSSQSQFLSPIHKSPQRLPTNAEYPRRSNSLDEDSIPSSQIQERELTVSRLEPKSRFRQMGTALPVTSQTPTRTFSDELFSVPIQSPNLSNIFPSDEGLEESQPPSAVYARLGAAENISSDSATESETDNEREGTNPHSNAGCLDTYHRYDSQPTHPSFQSESFPASLGISSSSLPPIVRVFRDMPFGNDDESYPPDFPMSLRS